MEPEAFLVRIIDPGLRVLRDLGGPSITELARQYMLAIALQESGPSLRARYQHSPAATPGPARGHWQFEQGGGVAGVLTHAACRTLANLLCDYCVVVPAQAAVWRALEGHNDLAVGFARLLLWSDPRALVATEAGAWEYYLRNWRPGKPHPAVWPGNWRRAATAVRAADIVEAAEDDEVHAADQTIMDRLDRIEAKLARLLGDED